MPSAQPALIDRRLAVAVASRATGSTPKTSPEERREIGEQIREVCLIAEKAVQEFTGWNVPPGPAPEVLSRVDWVEANLAGLEPILALAGSRVSMPGLVRAPLRTAMSVQMGLLFAYLSRRVIAQFDLMGGERLLFVGSNIVETERRAKVHPRSFRMWVAIHEVTHRLQFGGASWLRPALEDLIEQSLTMVGPAGRSPADIARRLRAALADSSPIPAVSQALLTEQQREVLRRAQTLMSSVEGHASFVMDRVGAELIDDVDALRKQVEGARGTAPGIEKSFQKVIGLEAKKRQYTEGKSFFDEIAETFGLESVQEAWRSETSLPTADELANHHAWGARVLGEAAPRS